MHLSSCINKDFLAFDPKHISSLMSYLNTHQHSEMRPCPIRETFIVHDCSGPASGYLGQNSTWVQKDLSASIPGNINAQSMNIYHPYLRHNSSSQNILTSFPHSFGVLFDASCFECDLLNKKLNNNIPKEVTFVQSVISSGMVGRFAQGSVNPKVSFVQNGYQRESTLHFQKLVVLHEIFKAKNVTDPKSLKNFFKAAHGNYNSRGLGCDCLTLRKCVLHYVHCKSSSCAFCVPVRSRSCIRKSIGPNTYISGPWHPRDCFDHDAQVATKRIKMWSSDMNDDWSISAVVSQKCQPPEWNSLTNQTKLTMSEELLISKEATRAAPESTAHAENGALTCSNMCSNKITGNFVTCASDRSFVQSNEISYFTGNIQENLGTQIDTSQGNLGNEDVSQIMEEPDLLDPQLMLGHVDVNDVKSENLKSGEAYTLGGKLFSDQGEKSNLMAESMDYRNDKNCNGAESISQSEKKLQDLKYFSVSMTDFLMEEEIEEYLHSLNEFAETESVRNMNVDDCQLCATRLRKFHAPPKCCALCGALIKHGLNYYSTLDGNEDKLCFCGSCFSKSHGRYILFGGLLLSKLELKKLKHTEEFEEAWVRCDKCDRWQHQICGLYNSKHDFEEKAKYICPFCRLAAMKMKEPLSSPVACGAQDLPRTKLSDHLEHRLFRSLEQERKKRSELAGKSFDEVPGAPKLTVRVVSASSKVLKVKQQFLDLVHGENYPVEFPYKSKVILLFQKAGGADVCLFAIYVQEYGSECGDPNKRAVYISYLDSVKYFVPELKTATGVALRTFVYHEILIGYLDNCKKRGFITCYIWACPPLKNEDYILYCHPESQKRPSPTNLIQWYNKMIHKAIEDDVVVEHFNFHDYVFNPKEEHNSKYSATRLPYFDGDYCSGAIEDLLLAIEKDSKGDYKKQLLKQMRQKELNSMGLGDLSDSKAKEILYMQKLEKKISSAKEQFFVLRLQYTCTKCHEAILSESRWDCKQCRNFHMCSRCIKRQQFLRGSATHTNKQGVEHILHEIPVTLPANTEDDAVLENELFDSRYSFLEFCKTNFCMFDTLRRAKYSSMLILHNLNTVAATKNIICSSCHEKLVRSLFGNDTFRFCKSCLEKYELYADSRSKFEDHVRKIRRVDVQQEIGRRSRLQRPPTGKRSKRKRVRMVDVLSSQTG